MSLNKEQLAALELLADRHGKEGIYSLHAYFCSSHPKPEIKKRFETRTMFMHLHDDHTPYYHITDFSMRNPNDFGEFIPPALLKLGFVEEAMYASQLAQEIKI